RGGDRHDPAGRVHGAAGDHPGADPHPGQETVMPSDDLSDLIVPHWTQGAPATPRLGGPPGKPASYGQGVIVAWDSSTFENTVRFHGTELHNLPAMAGADALTFPPGGTACGQSRAPGGGAQQVRVLLRVL